MIFAVPDTKVWHRENLTLHPHHYSWPARLMGHEWINWVQEEWGKGLYCNMMVPWGVYHSQLVMLNYGVINTACLAADLLDWETLQVAGLLHSPVDYVEFGQDKQLKKALRVNLLSAVNVALLLLPDKFTEEKLFLTLAGLNYLGDSKKNCKLEVANIVTHQMFRFREMYSDILKEFKEHLDIRDGMCVQDTSLKTRYFHLINLPSCVQEEIVASWNMDGMRRDMEEVLESVTDHPDLEVIVEDAVKRIVGRDKTKNVRSLINIWVSRKWYLKSN